MTVLLTPTYTSAGRDPARQLEEICPGRNWRCGAVFSGRSRRRLPERARTRLLQQRGPGRDLAAAGRPAPRMPPCADVVQRDRQVLIQGERLHRVWEITVAMIRSGVPADLSAASDVYRSASLSNAGDRDNLLAHPEYLVLGPERLAEGRTYVAEDNGSLVGFATWLEAGDIFELEDLFVDPGWRRRGIATALVNRIAQVLRARGVERLEVTANPHALGFYRAAGFIDCGVADTVFGAAPRMVLAIH